VICFLFLAKRLYEIRILILKIAVSCLLLIGGLPLFTSCQSTEMKLRKTTEAESPAVIETTSEIPAPRYHRDDPYAINAIKRTYHPTPQLVDKASLVYQANIDLVSIKICSEERIVDGNGELQLVQQQIHDRLSRLGFRVVNVGRTLPYHASLSAFAIVGNQKDIDFFVMIRAKAYMVDKVDSHFLYEADGYIKVVQGTGHELLTVQQIDISGKRGMTPRSAGESALTICGAALVNKVSEAIVRKSSRGMLLRRISIHHINEIEVVNQIKRSLSKKLGVHSVALKKYDKSEGHAIFWVRSDVATVGVLGEYLSQVDGVKIKVHRSDPLGVGASMAAF